MGVHLTLVSARSGSHLGTRAEVIESRCGPRDFRGVLALAVRGLLDTSARGAMVTIDRALRRFCVGLLALAWSIGGPAVVSVVRAAPEQGDASPSPPNVAPEDAGAADGSPPVPATETQALRGEIARQQKELQDTRRLAAEAQKAAEDARQAAATAQKAAEDANAGASEGKPDVLRIYGFTEVGFERLWLNEAKFLGPTPPAANASSFVLGNLDFYFDAQPIRDWRSLVEIRYSNAPLGTIQSFGGLGGQFSRVSTRQSDPNAASPIAQQWAGEIIIERAQIDWTPTQLFKLRVGDFFTPFGIWNVDHGSPTLIPIALPDAIAYGSLPLRQIGLMAYGNAFVGPWELGYMATLTNGRQELSNFAFDDNRGFGGRLYGSKDSGDTVLKFGVSGYAGHVRDKEVDLVNFSPITFATHSTFRYLEWNLGADVSLDLYRTRIRIEGLMHRVQYDSGQHELNLFNPTQQLPNRYESSVYAVVAQQLPWLGLEPYVMGEVGYFPIPLPGTDTTSALSVGLNIHFSPSVLLKTQLVRSFFFGTRSGSYVAGADPANEDFSAFYSRLVLVF
jgi:hypothetical protein